MIKKNPALQCYQQLILLCMILLHQSNFTGDFRIAFYLALSSQPNQNDNVMIGGGGAFFENANISDQKH